MLFKRLLDVGAQTLLVPYVESAEEAKRAVIAARYPPLGRRGVATTHRANRYGRVTDYYARATDETCVLVQLETTQAVAALEEIAAVDGVDGVFIGPSDLAASMGFIGQPAHPEPRKLIADACRRAKGVGIPSASLRPWRPTRRCSWRLASRSLPLAAKLGCCGKRPTTFAPDSR